MADSIIYNLPEEVRPEHIERYVVPMQNDGSIHLDNIHFRAHDGVEEGNAYLAIWGDRFNGLPGLFNIFSDNTQTDVWLRFAWMNTIRARRSLFIVTLVFSEWITDSYYYGAGTDWGTNAVGISVNTTHNAASLSEDFSSVLVNDFGSSDSSPVAFGSGIGTDPIIDLHVTRTGLNANRGGSWDSEVYVDGILRFTAHHESFGDVGHNLGRAGIGGMVFGSQYGNYSNPNYIPVDAVMVGTYQGGHDLMDVADFEVDYSPLDDSLDGSPHTFEILYQ